MRPLGAVLIGSLADRRGRKTALTLTIALMTAGTALIAFTPTHASIGVTATVLVVLRPLAARLVGGRRGRRGIGLAAWSRQASATAASSLELAGRHPGGAAHAWRADRRRGIGPAQPGSHA
ncbi:hypothetical protein ACU4GD_08395 [Cupriavidus basilensis]